MPLAWAAKHREDEPVMKVVVRDLRVAGHRLVMNITSNVGSDIIGAHA